LLGEVDLPHASLPEPPQDVEVAQRSAAQVLSPQGHAGIGGGSRGLAGVFHDAHPDWTDGRACSLLGNCWIACFIIVEESTNRKQRQTMRGRPAQQKGFK
jgi:hypothetical protein